MSMSSAPAPTDVAVVGAGPTGLLLAGDLAAAGVACTVLERQGQESRLTRAFIVHARTLEQLDARAVADELIETGTVVSTMQLFGDLDLELSRLRSRFPYLVSTPQYNTERILQDRASALGVTIVRGAEVIDLRQDSEGVDIDVRSADGTVHTRRARYAVGADGVHSAVRRALDLPFPGRAAVQSVMLADVRLTTVPERELTVNANRHGFSFIAGYGDGWYRLIAWDRQRQLPDTAAVTLDEVSDITRRTLGTDYGMHDPRWLSRFHSDERQVSRYRVGRVFLAGDAAHVHSPAGGQGMNTGIQDAANLGWKLAAAVHGWAPDGLLDSYHAERHPVGRMVLHNSSRMLALALARTRRLRLARAVIPVVAGRIGPLTRKLSETMSGIGIAYPAPPGAHRLVGRRAPDISLAGAGSSRLYEALRTGHFVLLARDGFDTTAVGRWAGRIDHHTPADRDQPTMLIRPDGYVAWATDKKDAAVRPLAELSQALGCGGAP